MEDLFKVALGISTPWRVMSVDFDATRKRLDIRLEFARGTQFPVTVGEGDAAKEVLCPVYDTELKSWRHLNFFEHECHLHARVPRVTTPEGRVVMVLPPWAGKLAGFTLLFEAFLLKLCKHMVVHQVGKLTGVSDYKLWRMLDLYVRQAQYDADWSEVTAAGMDETSVAKGHQYITLFVDTAQRRTLFVTEGKGADTVKEFAEELKNNKAVPEQITDISCDMSPAFIKGVKEHLPQARITFDKFHIIKILNEAVDAVRRKEAKTNPLLKGTKYIFLKNEANLNDKQRAKKQELDMANLNLDTMRALQMRETFQQLYSADSTDTFIAHLKQWVSSVADCGLEAMEKAAETVVNHWDGIVAWKASQLNNGILEGLNSVVQAAKRKARGYKPKHLITMTYFLTAKLDFKSVNPFA
jgi:transposase